MPRRRLNQRGLESLREPLPSIRGGGLGGPRRPDDENDPSFGIPVPGLPPDSPTNTQNPGNNPGRDSGNTNTGNTNTGNDGSAGRDEKRPQDTGGGGLDWSGVDPGPWLQWADELIRNGSIPAGTSREQLAHKLWTEHGRPGASGPGASSDTKKDESPFRDWGALFGFNIPQSLIDQIMQQFGEDPDTNRAVSRALAFLRGTQWYKDTFPGIGEGIKRGLFTSQTPEAEYRQWLAQVQQVWARYNSMGGTLDKTDLEFWLSQGFSADTVERRFQGRAFAQTYGADLRYVSGAFDTQGALTDEETTELGFHQAGLHSARGLSLAKRVEDAQRRMERIFQGVLATPMFEQRSRGIAAASLAPQRGRPDIGA